MGYVLKSSDKDRINGSIEISGEASKIVKEKITEVKSTGVKVYGVNCAIQALLCELYKLKKANQQGQASSSSL